MIDMYPLVQLFEKELKRECMLTVLYLPFLNILLVPVSCVEGEEGKVVMTSFPAQECWSPTTVAPAVLSIAALAVFVPACIIFRFIFFNPDPLSSDPLARPLSRTDTIWLVLKTILVFVFRLSEDRVLQAIVLTLTTLAMFCIQILKMPLYRRVPNHVVAGSYAMGCGAGIGMVVVEAGSLGQEGVIATFLSLFVLCTCVGVVLSEIRWRQLLKKGLAVAIRAKEKQETPLEAEAEMGVLARIAMRKRAILASASEAQLYARIILHSHKLDDDTADFVESLYQITIEAFPREASLLVSYATFLLSYRGNPASATLQNRQALKLSPLHDVRFLTYCAERLTVEENKAASAGEGRLDVMAYLEFQKVFTQTQRYHQQTLSLMKDFWKTLGNDTVEVIDLRRICEQISSAEKKATAAYAKTIKAFPNNKQVYRSAAQFWAHVHHDYDLAAYYEEQADELENDRDGSQAHTRNSAISWGASWKLDEATMAEHRAYRENLRNRKSFAVERLSIVSMISLVSLCLLAIINFVVVFQLLNDFDRTISIEALVSSRRYLLQTSLLHTTEMVSAKLQNKPELFEESRRMLNLQMTELNEIHAELYELSYGKINQEIDAEWTDMQLNFKPVAENTTATFKTNQRTGGVTFLLIASQLAEATFDTIYDYQLYFDALNYEGYCKMDTPYELGLKPHDRVPNPQLPHSFERTAFLCTDEAVDNINITSYTQAGLFSFSVLLILVLGFAFFRPALNEIQKERNDTYLLFLTIPREIAAQVGEAINDGRSEKSGKKKRKSSSAAAASNLAAATGRDRTSAADKMDRKFRIKLSAALIFITLLFGITVLITTILLQDTKETPIELNNAGRRRLMGQIIAFLAEALLPAAQEDPLHRFIRTESEDMFEGVILEIEKSITALDMVHRVLETGGIDSDGFYIDGVSESADQAYLSNEERCMFNSPPCDAEADVEFVGLESVLQYFIQQARTLSTLKKEEFLSTVPKSLNELVRIKPQLMDGLQASTDLISDYATVLSANGKVNSGILMCCILIVIVFLYAFLFRPIVKHLREESYRTSALLLMIPPDTIADVESVRYFLETGKLGSVAEQAASRNATGEGMKMEAGKGKMSATQQRRSKERAAKAAKDKETKRLQDEQDKQEEAASNSQAGGIAVLRALNHAYCLVDNGSVLREVGPRLLEILGYEAAEIVGSSIAKIIVPPPSLDAQTNPGMLSATQDEANAKFFESHAAAVFSVLTSGTDPIARHAPVRFKTKAGSSTNLYALEMVRMSFDARPCILVTAKDLAAGARAFQNQSSSTESDDDDETASQHSTASRSSAALLPRLRSKTKGMFNASLPETVLAMSTSQASDEERASMGKIRIKPAKRQNQGLPTTTPPEYTRDPVVRDQPQPVVRDQGGADRRLSGRLRSSATPPLPATPPQASTPPNAARRPPHQHQQQHQQQQHQQPQGDSYNTPFVLPVAASAALHPTSEPIDQKQQLPPIPRQ